MNAAFRIDIVTNILKYSIIQEVGHFFNFRMTSRGCQLTVFFTGAALYLIVMSFYLKKREIRIVGVALEGSGGSPVIVFNDPVKGDFLPVPADPFDTEILIRDFVGEGDRTAAAWLGDLLQRNPPRRGIVEIDDEGRPFVRLEFGGLRLANSRYLPFGEGLALVRRLSVPLYADDRLFGVSRDELSYLTESRAFSSDFLYLTPPQYAPNIPME